MDFALSEEHEILRSMVQDFAAEKIAPFADEWDEKHYFPYEEVIKPMGELGLFGSVIPEEFVHANANQGGTRLTEPERLVQSLVVQAFLGISQKHAVR